MGETAPLLQVAPLVLVAVLAFGIGVSLGISGLGGFLVPALLVAVLGMDSTTAVTHGLISFVVPGVIGTWLYWRKDNRPSWRVAGLLCLGTVPGLLLGRLISQTASPTALQVILALLVLGSGIALLAQQGRARRRAGQSRPTDPAASPRVAILVPTAGSAGLLGGLATVLAGVGGPLITVPALIAIGLQVTPVVGAALLNSVFGVALGAVALAGTVRLDPVVLAVITGAQLIGVPLGARWQDRIPATRLIPVIAIAAMITAAWLLLRL